MLDRLSLGYATRTLLGRYSASRCYKAFGFLTLDTSHSTSIPTPPPFRYRDVHDRPTSPTFFADRRAGAGLQDCHIQKQLLQRHLALCYVRLIWYLRGGLPHGIHLQHRFVIIAIIHTSLLTFLLQTMATATSTIQLLALAITVSPQGAPTPSLTRTMTMAWALSGLETTASARMVSHLDCICCARQLTRFVTKGMTCNQPEATCDSAGCGVAAGPYAIAEINLVVKGSDYYDISAIAGASIPVSITPDNVNSASLDPKNPYTCGNPGSATPATSGMGAATWDFTPPSVEYQWVTPSSSNPATCKADSDCSGESCGLVYTSGVFGLVCGALSGHWTAGGVSSLSSVD